MAWGQGASRHLRIGCAKSVPCTKALQGSVQQVKLLESWWITCQDTLDRALVPLISTEFLTKRCRSAWLDLLCASCLDTTTTMSASNLAQNLRTTMKQAAGAALYVEQRYD